MRLITNRMINHLTVSKIYYLLKQLKLKILTVTVNATTAASALIKSVKSNAEH